VAEQGPHAQVSVLRFEHRLESSGVDLGGTGGRGQGDARGKDQE
jgi:hypothetical protein